MPVLRRLRNESVAATAVLTGYGTAPVSILSEAGVVSLSAFVPVSPAFANRSATLTDAAARSVIARLRPSVFVTGVVSAVQLQLAAVAREPPDAGSGPEARLRRSRDGNWLTTRVVGYTDGLSLAEGSSSWTERLLRGGDADELWTVAAPITAQAQRWALPWQRLDTVGSPSLEAWPAAVSAYGADALVALRLRTFRVPPETPVVLYFGGYGSGYAASVRTFAAGLKALQSRECAGGEEARGGAEGGEGGVPLAAADCRETSRPLAAFTPHPGPNITTDVERRIFAEAGVEVSFVHDVATPLLAAMANVTVSQDSTASVQSLLVSTPSLFAVGSGTPPSLNLAATAGLIEQVENASAFVATYDALQASHFIFDPSKVASQLGLPSGALERIASKVIAWTSDGGGSDEGAPRTEAGAEAGTEAAGRSEPAASSGSRAGAGIDTALLPPTKST